MKEIHEIHEDVLQFLLAHREKNPGFTFGLRKRNNSNRLKKGYWFSGNEYYVAISFWTGRDWKNKTPNIFFKIERNGNSFLEFSFMDSPEKRIIIDRMKENLDGVEDYLRGYIKSYHTDDYLSALRIFLEKDKPLIDDLIKLHNGILMDKSKRYNRLDLYSEKEFTSMMERIDSFRNSSEREAIDLPEGIFGIQIKSSIPPKVNVEIADIPKSARWIFLTGSNGQGKSTILKSIVASVLGGRLPVEHGEYDYSLIDDTSEISLSILSKDGERELKYIVDGHDDFQIPFSGFSAYGPIRLGNPRVSAEGISDAEVYKRLEDARGMFFDDALLFNVDMDFLTKRFLGEHDVSDDHMLAKELLFDIIEFLPDIIPNLIRIDPPGESSIKDLWTETMYILEDDEGSEFNGVNIEELSSGHKSLINLVGDMLIRLIRGQRGVNSLDQLKGVVVIDEIDIHLHPRNQKALVEGLSDALPGVQFIVSTHSPIPLLGAPEGSVFLKVKRTSKDGISLQRLFKLEKEIKHLLPNAILTSEIFDFNIFETLDQKEIEEKYFEDNYEDIEKNRAIDERLRNLDSSIFPDNLFTAD